MNILNLTNESPKEVIKGILPEFSFESVEIRAYLFVKLFSLQEDLKRLTQVKVFKEIFDCELEDLLHKYRMYKSSEYLATKNEIWKESETLSNESLLELFCQDYKNVEDRFSSLIEKKCQNYLLKINDDNPISQIVGSEFMANFASAFGLLEQDVMYLVLAIINKTNNNCLKSGHSDYISADIYELLFPEYSSQIWMEYIQNPKKLLDIGLLESKNVVSDWVYDYFVKKDFDFNLELYNPNDCYDMYELAQFCKCNEEPYKVISGLFGKCKTNRAGFYISVYGTEEFREKNVISHFARLNGYNTVVLNKKLYFLNDNTSFYNYVIAISAQLYKSTALIIPEGSAKIICNSTQMELFNKIQMPVFLLMNPFEITEDRRDDEDSDFLPEYKAPKLYDFAECFIMNWKLEIPARNCYSKELKEVFAKKGLSGSKINKIIEFCKIEMIHPSQWGKIVSIVESLQDFPINSLFEVIRSHFKRDQYASELRKNDFYDVSVLQTSIPIEDVIQNIRNSEKWRGNSKNIQSGLRILLFGISGGGKTSFVEYIANQLKRPLMIIRTSDIMRSKAGASEYNIKIMFSRASETNSIILIDEADSLLRDRKQLSTNWEVSLVNELIQQMELFPGILFCSTNLADFLDKATNRRFHLQVKFEKLKRNGIETLCKSYFKKYLLTEDNINTIYAAGEVCPGDFGVVFEQIRFTDPRKVTPELICNKLVQTVRAKNKEIRSEIGFSI